MHRKLSFASWTNASEEVCTLLKANQWCPYQHYKRTCRLPTPSVPVSWRQSIWVCTFPQRQSEARSGHWWGDDHRGCQGLPGKCRHGTNTFALSCCVAGQTPSSRRRSCWSWTSGGKRTEEGRAAASSCRSPGKEQYGVMLQEVLLSGVQEDSPPTSLHATEVGTVGFTTSLNLGFIFQ